jgi:hypothetical protein
MIAVVSMAGQPQSDGWLEEQKMCGTDYELMAALDEAESRIEEKLLGLLKEWKGYICVMDKTKRTIAEWKEMFCSYVGEQLSNFENQGRLNGLLK